MQTPTTVAPAPPAQEENKPPPPLTPMLWFCYLGLATIVILPMYVPIEKTLHLFLSAFFSIYIGCITAAESDAEAIRTGQPLEKVEKKDALLFPVFASGALFGLYLIVRFISKQYLNMLLVGYFFLVGTFALSSAAQRILGQFLPSSFLCLPTIPFKLRVPFLHKEENENFDLSFRPFDILTLILSSGAGAWYLATRHWCANNLFGLVFCVNGIQLISLSSFAVGAILMCGAFVYDIFWVFGTEVMVSVATGIDAPIKLLFPRTLEVVIDHQATKFSMLGLGDIVLPGIFIALLLRYDVYRNSLTHSKGESYAYFYTNIVAYMAGMGATVGVMIFFEAAQPALLYLVPACLGTSLIQALIRGELFGHDGLLNFPPALPGDAKKEE